MLATILYRAAFDFSEERRRVGDYSIIRDFEKSVRFPRSVRRRPFDRDRGQSGV